MKNPPVRIGAHVSAAGGPWKAIQNAKKIGADCFQIFASNPRTWHVQSSSREEVKKFKDVLKKSGLGPVYLHSSYLPNLASGDDELWEKSVKNLSEQLKLCQLIGGRGLIFHLGSGTGDRATRISRAIKKVLKSVPGKSFLIMENSAGGGSKAGARLDEFKEIFRKSISARLKICIDTAHAFEAGESLEDFLNLSEAIVVHINDSKTNFGSNHDRHENIGQGRLGLMTFQKLLKDGLLYNKDWILEVPGFNGQGPDKKNVDILKNLFVVR